MQTIPYNRYRCRCFFFSYFLNENAAQNSFQVKRKRDRRISAWNEKIMKSRQRVQMLHPYLHRHYANTKYAEISIPFGLCHFVIIALIKEMRNVSRSLSHLRWCSEIKGEIFPQKKRNREYCSNFITCRRRCCVSQDQFKIAWTDRISQ